MDDFSKTFEREYVETLRRRHGTQRMNANNVYQEVIQDKHHVHMNSTKWATLTDFVQYLGKKGICVVEETERGWYVTYIERDPEMLARQERAQRKLEADAREEKLAAERREEMRLEAARALDRAGGVVERKAGEIGDRKDGEQIELKLGVGLSNNSAVAGKKRKAAGKISLVEEDDESDGEDEGHPDTKPKQKETNVTSQSNKHDVKPPHKRKADTDSVKKPKAEIKSFKKDHWLHHNIVVRIISKKLSSGKYYKRKAIVDKLIDKYTAEIEVLDSSKDAKDGGDILRIDQDDLETVIPKDIGEKVRIVNGKYRGCKARVERLDKKRYEGELRLCDEDRVVTLDYEDFSMIA
jgi:DNA/RNA-binding protein KIN17